MQYRKKLIWIALFFILSFANATCICNSTVTQEFNRITQKKNQYYKKLDSSIDKLKDQTKKLTSQQDKELPAVQAALDNYLVHYENEFKKTKLIENSNEALSVLIEQMLLKSKTILSDVDIKAYKQIEIQRNDINQKIKKINDAKTNYIQR